MTDTTPDAQTVGIRAGGRPVIDVLAVLAAMQDQLDDLTAAVAAQQSTIEALAAAVGVRST
jgi:hypothetical protein